MFWTKIYQIIMTHLYLSALHPVATDLLLEVLKAYSQILNRGHSHKFQNLKFLHLLVALLWEAHFPKGIKQKSFQCEIRAIFPLSLEYET